MSNEVKKEESKKVNNDLLKNSSQRRGGKFQAYDYSFDKDFSGLDTTDCEMLDKIPRKSIKEQVEMFIEAGVRLDETRRQMMSAEFDLEDDELPEDLDELSNILDQQYPDVQDYDEALNYLKERKKEAVKRQKEQASKAAAVNNQVDQKKDFLKDTKSSSSAPASTEGKS